MNIIYNNYIESVVRLQVFCRLAINAIIVCIIINVRNWMFIYVFASCHAITAFKGKLLYRNRTKCTYSVIKYYITKFVKYLH